MCCIGHQLPLHCRSLPVFVVDRVGKTTLSLLVKGLKANSETLYLLSKSVKGQIRDAMPWLLIYEHVLRQFWLLLDGKRAWSLLAKWMFPKFTNFGGWEVWCYRTSMQGTWCTVCRKTLLPFCHSGNARDGSSTASFYTGLVKAECDGILGETLGLDDNQLVSLFLRTFRPKMLDNFQKCLT